MTPDLLSVAIRALDFVALFQAAGAAFFLARFNRHLARAGIPIRRLALGAAAAGAILALVHLELDAARMSGDFAGLYDPDLQRLAWTGMAGISQTIQATGLLLIIVALRTSARNPAAWSALGGVVAVGSFLLTGHTRAHPWHAVLLPLLALHLLVVAFWFGSLAPLALVIRHETRATALRLLHLFSVVAGRLVPLILVAGLAMAWLLAGSFDVLGKPYGELLIVKLAGFALLMTLAAYNRWHLVPKFEQWPSPASLRRSLAAEYALIVAVLSVTAVLTAFYSPE